MVLRSVYFCLFLCESLMPSPIPQMTALTISKTHQHMSAP
jgi:hypothetical protein